MRYTAYSFHRGRPSWPLLQCAPADDHIGEDVLVEYGQHILRENHYPHCSTIVGQCMSYYRFTAFFLVYTRPAYRSARGCTGSSKRGRFHCRFSPRPNDYLVSSNNAALKMLRVMHKGGT